ncbi:receptor-interacting serine/threonine-protein kinase 3-like isoform X1 [Rhinatrema bivittatum]|uniref:receptor-interacting serine/threonine-protein kinase 3-like isoform X1 n=1 Tax=Rhinatrema bivittatum TaxID=194408 RepID=UPI001126D55F|nr:receptor-interacting serine/threonine-protein kinase 3-like isoform X1 [Rhinatrema bivittatum]
MLHVPRGQRPSLDHLGDLQRVQKLADMKHLMEKCWDQDPSSRPSFKDCVVTTEEIFMAHKHQVKEAVRNVQSALEKMETSSQQSLSRVPPCSALSSGPSSEIVERFPTLTLLEPPSLENGAVPLGSPAAPSAEPSCPAPPSASSEKAQKGTPRVTRWPPNEKERPDPVPQQPASSAQGKPQGKGAWERHAAAPSQIRHPSPVPRRSHIFLTGSQLSNIQIGNNNVMEVRSTTVTRSKKKK